MKQLDINKDGVISFEEYAALYKQLEHGVYYILLLKL